jgi:nucleoside-diphosphate-sugar epimerase
MRTLLTGASGFLGKYISNSLIELNYKIISLGIEDECEITCDLRYEVPLILDEIDLVIHAAGKAHVIPKTDEDKQSFFDINLQGTKNLCSALGKNKLPKAFIFISSVAVYGMESGESIDESQPLNGLNPYALSKIKAEDFLIKWCSTNNIILGILRPSLIAGKNPPGNLGEMIKGIESKKYFRIDKGSARKSILMADDIARLIPRLAEVGGIYNVCDNVNPSFAELEKLIANQLNIKPPKSIPYWVAKSLALFGDLLAGKFPINSTKLDKLTKSLTFSNEKAKVDLSWEPLDVLQNFKIH